MSEKLGSDLSYEFVFLSFWQYSAANATRNGLRFLLKTIQTKAVFLSQSSNHKKRMSGAAWKCLRWNVELVWKIQVIIWIFFLGKLSTVDSLQLTHKKYIFCRLQRIPHATVYLLSSYQSVPEWVAYFYSVTGTQCTGQGSTQQALCLTDWQPVSL